MYGLIGKFTATDGARDELMRHLVDGSRDMPGCHSYVVAADSTDTVTIWVTEVWDSPDAHMASLDLEQVQAAISKARPLIAGMARIAETSPPSA
ncbi:putative quinol monooxygenase [Pelagovum pacificum]|uniref:Antibiotic biosynthesis monooxygenase n=1 Tax=Pelagovum pacificum TaxID=2588711 RepID=A0A5C5GG53_9RHOB|nr:putative quinol monooxygenase [Pelagovum pacificum]QQA43363.1 antibiotic biosynthesis monooxygenase [Pelagovum pacificum]TNY33500.1 antibiotic biosynthesis monooxygenase [Pelagovum pacificum]